MKNNRKTLWVALFSIAMGFLESAVVIYLRRLLYADGFSFPLRPLHHDLALVEVLREACTIIMLLSIGMITGRNRVERLSYFIFSFAIWDIFYYIFLYVFLGWPQSVFTWDILFLIPVPWVGPVLAPLILSGIMILFTLAILNFSRRSLKAGLRIRESLLMASGSLICIISFTEEYINNNGPVLFRNLMRGGSLLSEMANYRPEHFQWPVFFTGVAVLLGTCYLYCIRMIKVNRQL